MEFILKSNQVIDYLFQSKGRLHITISHKKDGFVKSLSAEIVQIIRLANEKYWLPSNSSKFEIIQINGIDLVRSKLQGKCKFRLGVEQHITLREENI